MKNNNKDVLRLLKILPFYNSYIDKPKIQKLHNVDLLKELPFYNELSITKNINALHNYAGSYKVEIVDKKDPLVQLETSKSSIISLFKDLLYELKGFKYQITVNILLSKLETDGNIEYSSVYFNSTTKAVINTDKFNLNKSFQEILYRIDNWINLECGWITERINSQYLNVSFYSPLIGSTYIKLLNELEHPKKGLIIIQNNDNKCFMWCHIRHLNLICKNSQRITKKDKELVSELDYEKINFPV